MATADVILPPHTVLQERTVKSIFVLASVALLVGCNQSIAPPPVTSAATSAPSALQPVNRSSMKVGDFTITTELDVPMSNSMQDASAILKFGNRTLTADFGKRQITIDNGEPLALPAETKEIQVRYVGGDLTISADGRRVFPANK